MKHEPNAVISAHGFDEPAGEPAIEPPPLGAHR
jgi:hypothetical protein